MKVAWKRQVERRRLRGRQKIRWRERIERHEAVGCWMTRVQRREAWRSHVEESRLRGTH